MDGARAPTPHAQRLLLVVNNVEPGGAERHAMHLAEGLSRRGHDVVLLALGHVRTDVEALQAAGVRVSALGAVGPRARLAALPALTRMARAADLVHCTNWDPSLYGRLAALLARRPVVVTDHTVDRSITVSRRGSPRGRWIAAHHRLLGRLTAATVHPALSQESVLAGEGVPRERLVHIGNGVPVESIRTAAASALRRSDLGIPDQAEVVIHVANFRPEKNHEQTLATVAALRQRGRDVRALFVGSGPRQEAVHAQAAQLGADWAVFLGERSDVPALLALADVLVLPSRTETMPLVVLEAMALGVPVVAYDVGDVPRVLQQGGGLCVPQLDGGAFTEACLRVLDDRPLRDRLAQQGRAASAGFDAERMVERYEEVFDAALGPADDGAARLRILHVGPDVDGRGGMPAVISDLLASPLADRHRVEFVATYGSATYGENVDQRQRLITFVRGLLRVLRWSLGRGTRVVHIHAAFGGSWYRKAVCVVAVRAARRPVILHVHSGAGTLNGFCERLGTVRLGLIARAFRAADRVVAVSRASASEIERWLHVPDVLVVPNVAGLARVPAPANAADSRSDGRTQVLYLGGFANEAKGGRVLAEALPALVAAAPHVSVSLAGLGSPPRLDEVADSVDWRGWLDAADVDAALQDADIVVLPSLSEGLPVALLEALGHGKAVVATSAGGIPEIVTDGVDAVLVRPGDGAALARAIAELAADPARRARLGRAARARAERLSRHEIYDTLEQLYFEVAGQPRKKRRTRQRSAARPYVVEKRQRRTWGEDMEVLTDGSDPPREATGRFRSVGSRLPAWPSSRR
jgi:glycosyltransferase involved in cell wall biosynthesis